MAAVVKGNNRLAVPHYLLLHCYRRIAAKLPPVCHRPWAYSRALPLTSRANFHKRPSRSAVVLSDSPTRPGCRCWCELVCVACRSVLGCVRLVMCLYFSSPVNCSVTEVRVQQMCTDSVSGQLVAQHRADDTPARYAAMARESARRCAHARVVRESMLQLGKLRR